MDHSREITDLTLDSVRQYKEMGVFTESGGFEVARTEERMEELRRRMSSARAWGIESELVDPAFVAEKVPFLDPDQIIGAFWTPSVGVVDSLRAGTIMREKALESGALTVVPTVEVTGLDTEETADGAADQPGPHHRRRHRGRARGDRLRRVEPEDRRHGRHQHPADPGGAPDDQRRPCPQLAGTEGEISFPIVRDMDTFCYERQHGADMEVGSYAHRAILHEPEEIPSIEQAKLSPTEMPFTSDDFDPQLEQAYELMPELLGADGAEIRYAINGLLSLTCDGNPILGESQVKGLWTAAAVWIKEGPGVGRAVAEWMTARPLRDRRPPQRHRAVLPAPDAPRAHPAAHHRVVHQDLRHRAPRPSSTSPTATSGSPRCTSPRRKLGARFFEAVGWERPQWYESNADLLEEYGDAVMPREHEWDSRWWSPIVNAEHLRMREAAGVIDLTAFAIFDITGPGRPRRRAAHLRRAVRRRGRQGDLHPGARRQGRLPLRPHRDAARRRPLPRRHRRRARHGRPQVVRRPARRTTGRRR